MILRFLTLSIIWVWWWLSIHPLLRIILFINVVNSSLSRPSVKGNLPFRSLKALCISRVTTLDNASCSWGQCTWVQVLKCPDGLRIVHFYLDKHTLGCCVIAMTIVCSLFGAYLRLAELQNSSLQHWRHDVQEELSHVVMMRSYPRMLIMSR